MLRFLAIAAVLLLATPAYAAGTVLVPTSGWLVGPSTLVADAEGGLPCVMTNQFSNGFVMRISGGGGRIMGLALDVRQNFFTPGKAYDLGVVVAPDFKAIFKAEAYDPSTIMVNAEAKADLYKALHSASSMSLAVGGKTLEFVMIGANDGLDRIEGCFKPSAAGKTAQKIYVPQTPQAAAEKPIRPGMHTTSGVAAAYNKLKEQDNTAPPLTAAPSAAGQTMPPAKTAPAAAPQLHPVAEDMAAQEPAAGSIDARLAKMFDRAETSVRSVQPAAATAGAPVLQKAPSPPRNPIADSIMPSALPIAPREAAPPRQMQVQKNAATEPVRAAPEAREMARQWAAQAGVGLRETLDSWAQQAHARLVWQAPQDYMLPASLTAQGTFESAVLSALKQFESEDTPPLGQIYVDPVTGQKVLLIGQ